MRAIAGYRIVEHIARGDCLDVYSVWSAERDCLCIAKAIRPDRRNDRAAVRRLAAEGRLLQRLSHPGLVRGYETRLQPWPVIVMETLGGQTLSHLMDQRRQGLSIGDLAELGRQLVAVVGYLHRGGRLHLDLKPSNLVLDGGRLRVLDLSHARPPGPCPPGFGTDEYMAPEQWAGGRAGAYTDVFGVGGVLYRCATRRRPYEKDRGGIDERPLRRHRLGELIRGCLAPGPADRPDLPAVRAELDRYAAG
jgi:serine/threonine protein kinase